jgi:hypothetical protein
MLSLILATCLGLAADGGDDRPCVIVVVGAPGTPEYGAQFRAWAAQWEAAAKQGGAESVRIGLDEPRPGTPSDRDRLRAALAEKSAPAEEPLWLVLIGHGTYDGREAKLNLRGPDVAEAELAGWLAPLKRPVAVLDCTSASGPFLNKLSGPNRVVVTATRSGHEQNFARLGQYLAESIADPRADLDKDGQVSLLEAYLTASSRVAEYYTSRSQLATEHPLLDDNGDQLGTPPDWFRGIRATKRAKDGAPLDGIRAHQFHLVRSDREKEMPADLRQRRDRLEQQVAALRDEKPKLSEDAYYQRLEALMVDLAKIYRDLPGSGETKPKGTTGK